MEFSTAIGGFKVIRAYFGLPGTGKTYSMVRDLQIESKGRRVYANFHVSAPNAAEVIFMKSPLELIHCRDGIVLIDEAGLWMPSFIWKRIPEDLIWKLAQVRKAGLDLWYTAQHPARVVKILREITFESVYMEKWFGWFLARVKSGIDDGLISWRILRFSKKIGSLYDTMEMVSVLGKGEINTNGKFISTGNIKQLDSGSI